MLRKVFTLPALVLFSSLYVTVLADFTCIVPSNYEASNGTASDAPAIAAAFVNCSKNAVIEFQDGVEYNVFSPIKATSLSNVTISLKGNWNLPKDIPEVQRLVSTGGASTWFQFAGDNIHFIGTPNTTYGWIKSYGQLWWDAANAAGNKGLASRPHLISFKATNGTVQYYKASQPIAWGMSLSGKNVTVTDTVIDAVSTTAGFPYNTDGFDVGGTDIRIINSTINNGDDAVAIGSGAHNFLFQNAVIGGRCHGMSIGSLGENAASFANVSNIMFDNVTIANADYAARFKSWAGGQGLVKNITWSNIQVVNVTYPIYVTQTYTDSKAAGANKPRSNNSSVNMQDFTWANFSGTINSHGSHFDAVSLGCSSNSSCQGFMLKNITLTPANQPTKVATQTCVNAMPALNPNLGISCQNGTFVSPT